MAEKIIIPVGEISIKSINDKVAFIEECNKKIEATKKDLDELIMVIIETSGHKPCKATFDGELRSIILD